MKKTNPARLSGVIFSRNICVDIYFLNGIFNFHPQRQIGKDLYHAAHVGEGSTLQHGHIGYHAVLDNVFDNLIDKVDLS